MHKAAVITIKAGLWLFAVGRRFLDSICKDGRERYFLKLSFCHFPSESGFQTVIINFGQK